MNTLRRQRHDVCNPAVMPTVKHKRRVGFPHSAACPLPVIRGHAASRFRIAYLPATAHFTALSMICWMFSSLKIGLVSWPSWK